MTECYELMADCGERAGSLFFEGELFLDSFRRLGTALLSILIRWFGLRHRSIGGLSLGWGPLE